MLGGCEEVEWRSSVNLENENTRKSARLLLKKSDVPISEIDSKAGVLWSTIGCVGLEEKRRKRKMMGDENVVKPKKTCVDVKQEQSPSSNQIRAQRKHSLSSKSDINKKQKKVNKDCCLSNELKKLNKNAHSKFLRSGSRTGHVKSEGARWREFMREGIQDQALIRKKKKIFKAKQNNLHLKKCIGDCQSKEEMHGYLIKCMFEDAMMPPTTLTYNSQLNSYLRERQLIKNIINEEEFVFKMEQLKLALIRVFRENPGFVFRQNEHKIMNHLLKSFNSYCLNVTLDAMMESQDSSPKLGEQLCDNSQLSRRLQRYLYGSSESFVFSINLRRKCINLETSVFYKSVYLVYLMERIKINKILRTDPPLINKLSKFKRSVQILMELRDLIFIVPHAKSHSNLKDSLTEILNEYFHYRQLTSYEFHDSHITTYNSLFSIARLEEYIRITTGKVIKLYPLKKFYKNDGGFKSLKRNMTLLKANGFSLKFNIDVSSTVKENNLKLLWEVVLNQMKKVRRPFKRIGFVVLFSICIGNEMRKSKDLPKHDELYLSNDFKEHCSMSGEESLKDPTNICDVEEPHEADSDLLIHNFSLEDTSEKVIQLSDLMSSPVVSSCENNDSCKDSAYNNVESEGTNQRNLPLDLTIRDRIVGNCKNIISIRRTEPYDYSEIFSKSPPIANAEFRSSSTSDRLTPPKLSDDPTPGFSSTYDRIIPSNDSCYDSLEPLSNESNIDFHSLEIECNKKEQSQGSEELIDILTVETPQTDEISAESELKENDLHSQFVERNLVSFTEKSDGCNTDEKEISEDHSIDNISLKSEDNALNNLQDDEIDNSNKMLTTDDKQDTGVSFTTDEHNHHKQTDENASEGIDLSDWSETRSNMSSYSNKIVDETLPSCNYRGLNHSVDSLFKTDKSDKDDANQTLSDYKNSKDSISLQEIIDVETTDSLQPENSETNNEKHLISDDHESLNIEDSHGKVTDERGNESRSQTPRLDDTNTNLSNNKDDLAKEQLSSSSVPEETVDICQERINDCLNQRNVSGNAEPVPSVKGVTNPVDVGTKCSQADYTVSNSECSRGPGRAKLDVTVARLKKSSGMTKNMNEALKKDQAKTKPFDFIKTSLSLGSGYEGLQEAESTDSSWLEDLESSTPIGHEAMDSAMLLQNFGPSFSYFDSGVNLIQLSSFGSNVNRGEASRCIDPYSYGFPNRFNPSISYECDSVYSVKDNCRNMQQRHPIDYRTSSHFDSRNVSRYHSRILDNHGSSYSGNHLPRSTSNPYHHSTPPFYHYSIQYPASSSHHSFYPESYYSPSALSYSVPSTNYNSNTYNFFIDNRSSHTYLTQPNHPTFPNSSSSQSSRPLSDTPHISAITNDCNTDRGRMETSNNPCQSSVCYSAATPKFDQTQNTSDKSLSKAKTVLQQSLKRKYQSGPSSFNPVSNNTTTSVNKNLEGQAPPSISSPEIREILNTFLDNGSSRNQPTAQNSHSNAQSSATSSVRYHTEVSEFQRDRSCSYARSPASDYTHPSQNQMLPHHTPSPLPNTKHRPHYTFEPPYHQELFPDRNKTGKK